MLVLIHISKESFFSDICSKFLFVWQFRAFCVTPFFFPSFHPFLDLFCVFFFKLLLILLLLPGFCMIFDLLLRFCHVFFLFMLQIAKNYVLITLLILLLLFQNFVCSPWFFHSASSTSSFVKQLLYSFQFFFLGASLFWTATAISAFFGNLQSEEQETQWFSMRHCIISTFHQKLLSMSQSSWILQKLSKSWKKWREKILMLWFSIMCIFFIILSCFLLNNLDFLLKVVALAENAVFFERIWILIWVFDSISWKEFSLLHFFCIVDTNALIVRKCMWGLNENLLLWCCWILENIKITWFWH